jgi:serine/threonine protein kinase
MTRVVSKRRSLSVGSELRAVEIRDYGSLALEIKQAWQAGTPPDAGAALEEHPGLCADKSIVLDLAYEEYCLRREAGEDLDADVFCERFPTHRASLRRLVEAHRFLENHPELLAAKEPVRWPKPPETFAGFALRRELGRGAFARVFLASEAALGGRRVAVKVSLRGAGEAETLGRIQHPNIVPVHSVREDSATGLSVVCMPYLGSATLCDVLDEVLRSGVPRQAGAVVDIIRRSASGDGGAIGEAPGQTRLFRGTYVDAVLRIGAELCEGLASIHALGIYHRDLKPSNILLALNGRAMLLDFNLSGDEAASHERLGGTLPYMAPEQLRATDREDPGGPYLLDARSDLFSLGVILYELLTGRHPYGPVPLNGSITEIRGYLLREQCRALEPVWRHNGLVDRRLGRLIERCLAPNPADRPQSARELGACLRGHLTWPRRLWRQAVHHPWLAGLALSLCLATGSAGTYSIATLDPYPVRETRRGQESYQRRDFADAVQHFTRVLQSDPENAEVLYARGRAHQQRAALDWYSKRGRTEIALGLADYEASDRLAEAGRTKACMAYLLAKDGNFGPAERLYEDAIKDEHPHPHVWNNLGDVRRRLARRFADMGNAEEALFSALKADPGLQAAWYNLALIELQKAWWVADYVPDAGIGFIDRALSSGPPTTDLHAFAFHLYAEMAKKDGRRRLLRAVPTASDPWSNAVRVAVMPTGYDQRLLEAARSHLDQALQQGQSFKECRASLIGLEHQPAFRNLQYTSIPAIRSTRAPSHLDPAPDFRP